MGLSIGIIIGLPVGVNFISWGYIYLLTFKDSGSLGDDVGKRGGIHLSIVWLNTTFLIYFALFLWIYLSNYSGSFIELINLALNFHLYILMCFGIVFLWSIAMIRYFEFSVRWRRRIVVFFFVLEMLSLLFFYNKFLVHIWRN